MIMIIKLQISKHKKFKSYKEEEVTYSGTSVKIILFPDDNQRIPFLHINLFQRCYMKIQNVYIV